MCGRNFVHPAYHESIESTGDEDLKLASASGIYIRLLNIKHIWIA